MREDWCNCLCCLPIACRNSLPCLGVLLFINPDETTLDAGFAMIIKTDDGTTLGNDIRRIDLLAAVESNHLFLYGFKSGFCLIVCTVGLDQFYKFVIFDCPPVEFSLIGLTERQGFRIAPVQRAHIIIVNDWHDQGPCPSLCLYLGFDFCKLLCNHGFDLDGIKRISAIILIKQIAFDGTACGLIDTQAAYELDTLVSVRNCFMDNALRMAKALRLYDGSSFHTLSCSP